MFTCDGRCYRVRPELRWPRIGAGLAAMALVSVLACSSKDASGSGGGGSSASGGRTAGTGGDSGSGGADSGGGRGDAPGTGGSSTGGRGGVTGGGGGGSGGMKGTGGAMGTGGHDISPVICGTGMCQLTYECCIACDGSRACAPTCTSPICPDAGVGGSGPVDAAQTDADSDGAGSLRCGTMTCGPQEACVTPPGPGTCVMPDGGRCPTGTSLSGSCCLPPLDPSCVAIDRTCSGPTVTCACFSVDPCGSGLCIGASFQGRNVMCHGA